MEKKDIEEYLDIRRKRASKKKKSNIGIVRKFDDLGRIVIPKEYRDILQLETRDAVKILVEDEKIIIQRYKNRCVFCGSFNPEKTYQNKKICKKCWEGISNDARK